MAGEEVQSNSVRDVHLPEDRKKLHDLAAQAAGDISVNEGGFVIPAAFLVFAVTFPVMGWQEVNRGRFLSMLIFLLTGAFMAFLFIRTMVRRRTPFFVLTPEGLVCSVFKAPLPLRAIKDFQINASSSNAYNIGVGMEFDVDEHLLPERNEHCRISSWYDEEKKRLIISGTNFQFDMNRDKVIALLKTYRTAALARHKLKMKDRG